MSNSYRSVSPELQLEGLRAEKDSLERELQVLRAEKQGHKCPPRFTFSNLFRRTVLRSDGSRTRETLYERNSRIMSGRAPTSRFRSKIIPILLAITTIAVFVSIIGSMFTSIQSGIITNRHHSASWVETHSTTDSNGRSDISTTFHPERWWVIVCDEGDCENEDMNEETWQRSQVGQLICLHNCRGI